MGRCKVPLEACKDEFSPENKLGAENQVQKSLSQKIRSIEVLSLHVIDNG
jgi:hypothetical protein